MYTCCTLIQHNVCSAGQMAVHGLMKYSQDSRLNVQLQKGMLHFCVQVNLAHIICMVHVQVCPGSHRVVVALPFSRVIQIIAEHLIMRKLIVLCSHVASVHLYTRKYIYCISVIPYCISRRAHAVYNTTNVHVVGRHCTSSIRLCSISTSLWFDLLLVQHNGAGAQSVHCVN